MIDFPSSNPKNNFDPLILSFLEVCSIYPQRQSTYKLFAVVALYAGFCGIGLSFSGYCLTV